MSLSNSSSCGNCNGQDKKESVRPMAVAGAFYPKDKSQLVLMMAEYFKPYVKEKTFSDIQAIIVPHAGYVFSGEVAASAIAKINPASHYDNIFLIGPSHQVYMDGASVNDQADYYETPLGRIKVDRLISEKLITDNSSFVYNPKAHDKEHCIEVQLPLLQYHLKEMPPIVPIIIGTQSFQVLDQIAEGLRPYFNEKNLFVISSDFSHYTTYENANIADKRTGEAIMTGSIETFIEALHENSKEKMPNLVTSACGQSAIAILMLLMENDPALKIHHILYKNSGDSQYGGKDQVVGYHAFTVTRSDKSDAPEESFHLSDSEKNTLLKIARHSIENKLHHTSNPVCDTTQLTDTLKMKCGAFVTLHEKGRLRGCIGRFGSGTALYKIIEEMARAAAFEDPRFNPLQPDELKDIDIEISVLSPLKRIRNIDEFHYGKEGIFMEKNGRTGTFLPQVAQDTHWTKEEFLGHCAQDKVGIGWDGWKDANLYTYEAVVFGEEGEKK